jgi:S1-C subfamily serine protease
MKLCQACGQLLAEEIAVCPSCGDKVVEGRKTIDDYRIVDVLHEGYSSILCRAVKEGSTQPVVIRIFTPQSGVDERIAERLKQELEVLHELPEDYFVRHYEIRKSSDGQWYRVSEWIDAINWGRLLASGRLQDLRVAFRLFSRIAKILEGLHRKGHFIPHLILDDIIVFEGKDQPLEVKIDYKLSRFLNPRLDRPGPMLKKLLDCHPDIINQRPLDFRSDIWSLGKIFMELLTADHESTDFSARIIEELELPPEAEVLLKIMLADDPNLRPQSMAQVAETLDRIRDKDLATADKRRVRAPLAWVREIQGLKRWIWLVAGGLILLAAVGIYFWLHLSPTTVDSETRLAGYANRYAGSVGFVLVDYWVKDERQIYYRNRSEGTAFLADAQGYLLTNRHVACPWLADNNIYVLRNHLGPRPLQLEYRAFLWFEGERAFKRLPELSSSEELDDVYHLDRAYTTGGQRRLQIVGVARVPQSTRERIRSPLQDDFAVLKIEPVPGNLTPLPLDERRDLSEIPKLLPVIALGFPLGSSTQEEAVNVSVTRGHVRRSFENFLQVDTSLYRGNSGGPVIDISGKVIGIASSVAIEWAAAPIPVATPLSDLGMVLPISKAVGFLREIMAGRPKWNGVLDLSIDAKLERITETAERHRWQQALQAAEAALKTSQDPSLVTASAVMHLCADDLRGSRLRFTQARSMDSSNGLALFMLYLLDWMESRFGPSVFRDELLALDWRSVHEFYGYLARILEGQVSAPTGPRVGGYSARENSWLHYIAGLQASKREAPAEAETRLQAALLAADGTGWIYFLASSALDQVRQQRLARMRPADRPAYASAVEKFEQILSATREKRLKDRDELAVLTAKFDQKSTPLEERAQLLREQRRIDPDNRNLIAVQVFLDLMREAWAQGLDNARAYLAVPGWENRGRLQIGLLVPEILHIMSNADAAQAELAQFWQQTRNRWYRDIAAALQGSIAKSALLKAAAESPECLLTAHSALGFWAEGSGDRKNAVLHYREALGSYMDEMLEYEFAVRRIQSLRQSGSQ